MSGKTILLAGMGAAALGGLAFATRGSIPGAVEQDWQKKLAALSDRSRRTLKAVSSAAWPGHTVTYEPNKGFFVDQKGPLDSPHQAATVLWQRKKAQANYEEDEEDDYEEAWRRREEEARELARALGLSSVGLNADWCVSAWHAGPSSSPNMKGGDVYILEDDEAYDPQQIYSVVRRWYVDEGHETGQKYLGLPKKYSEWADGANDAIVELGSFPTFAKAAKAAIRLRDQLSRKGHRASGRRSIVVPLHSVKNLKRVCLVLEEQFGWPANDWAFAGAGPSGTEAASLTLVRANQRGHYPIPASLRKLLRLPPFKSFGEAMDAAERLNELRGMSGDRAEAIIASSMGGRLANRRRRR